MHMSPPKQINIEHALGRHEASIDAMKVTQAEQATDIKAIKEDIHAIREMLAEAKGGWRTLMWVAGLAGTVGAAGAAAVSAMFSR